MPSASSRSRSDGQQIVFCTRQAASDDRQIAFCADQMPSAGRQIVLCTRQAASDGRQIAFCADQRAIRRSSDAVLHGSGAPRGPGDARRPRQRRLAGAADVTSTTKRPSSRGGVPRRALPRAVPDPHGRTSVPGAASARSHQDCRSDQRGTRYARMHCMRNTSLGLSITVSALVGCWHRSSPGTGIRRP
jgi:hypothetical protein